MQFNSYIGHRLNDTELIEKSEEDAQTIYDLFTFGNFNTFAEYNSGTYTGVGKRLGRLFQTCNDVSQIRSVGVGPLEQVRAKRKQTRQVRPLHVEQHSRRSRHTLSR